MLQIKDLEIGKIYKDAVLGEVRVLEIDVEKDEIRLEILNEVMTSAFIGCEEGGFKFKLSDTIKDFTIIKPKNKKQ